MEKPIMATTVPSISNGANCGDVMNFIITGRDSSRERAFNDLFNKAGFAIITLML
jgi:hypothetical protein